LRLLANISANQENGGQSPPYNCPNAEEIQVEVDESENSRSGGQKQLKLFRIFHFCRKSPWLKELEI
jgi:hypothetical protein